MLPRQHGEAMSLEAASQLLVAQTMRRAEFEAALRALRHRLKPLRLM